VLESDELRLNDDLDPSRRPLGGPAAVTPLGD
jgi:hypothetical protein